MELIIIIFIGAVATFAIDKLIDFKLEAMAELMIEAVDKDVQTALNELVDNINETISLLTNDINKEFNDIDKHHLENNKIVYNAIKDMNEMIVDLQKEVK